MADPREVSFLAHLRDALAACVTVLRRERVPHALVGGAAVALWGEPRQTQDLDFSVTLPAARAVPVLERLVAAGFRVALKGGVARAATVTVIPLAWPGRGGLPAVGVDLIVAGLPYEHEAIARARVRGFLGRRVRAIAPEDLVVMKLLAGRPRDLADVQSVLARRRERLDIDLIRRASGEIAAAIEDPTLVRTLDRMLREVKASKRTGRRRGSPPRS